MVSNLGNPLDSRRRFLHVAAFDLPLRPANEHPPQNIAKNRGSPLDSRRQFLASSSSKAASFIGLSLLSGSTPALAAQDSVQVTAEELDEIYREEQMQDGNNPPLPDVPAAPEEKSGLVVLRVAEVAQFQEKILRSIVQGDLEGVKVAPLQFSFGTRILLKNSNLDGNMKLMIAEEIPRSKRKEAARNASNSMNILQDIITFSNSIQRDFEPKEMLLLADMYKALRINLNQLYEYLPQNEKDKYYGYFVAVTEYEKKIAEGVYNPDIDGILKFD
ncbi:unnamed protein product [Cylindrotheca closterium]|uniref:Uncharacterized protein n=1 Tax=Cylindrotheca closterium TaxID=2856 RepID=A0AAD2JP72_9STRA|nr:unnamed protein product [Cylindrotheca closterium]